MRSIDTLLDNYTGDHLNPKNQLIHVICVPAIVWSVTAALWVIPVPEAFFKPGAWACTGEEFKLQVSGCHSYYANPVVTKIVGGPPEFCREIDSSRAYALPPPAATGTDADDPCPNRSCVAFVARVTVDGREYDWTLYAPNSFIAAAH